MFEILFAVIFFLVIGTFIINIGQGIGEWVSNNNSPRLTVTASVT